MSKHNPDDDKKARAFMGPYLCGLANAKHEGPRMTRAQYRKFNDTSEVSFDTYCQNKRKGDINE